MACNFRIAAESAVFGQPEIKLGIIPGFGGTQRLPRLVGDEKALEMNLIGDAISAGEAEAYGLANRVVPDHELFDTALSWARRLAGQAPVAVEQVKLASDDPDLDEGIEKEKEGFRTAFTSEDAQGGHQRLPRQAHAEVAGEVMAGRAAELASLIREADSVVALTGAGISVPSGIPDFRTPGQGALGEGRPDGGRPHRRLPPRHEALLELLPAALRRARREAAEPRPRGARRARGERGCSTRS